jgi:hypothetical protein
MNMTYREAVGAMARVGITAVYRAEGRSLMEFDAGADVKEWVGLIGKGGSKTGWHFHGVCGDQMLMLTARAVLLCGRSVAIMHLCEFYEMTGFELADRIKDIDVVCIRDFTQSRVASVPGPEEYRCRADMLVQRVFEADRHVVLSGHELIEPGEGWHNDWINRMVVEHCKQVCVRKTGKAAK